MGAITARHRSPQPNVSSCSISTRLTVGRVELINGDGPGLLRLDEELGARPLATTEPTA